MSRPDLNRTQSNKSLKGEDYTTMHSYDGDDAAVDGVTGEMSKASIGGGRPTMHRRRSSRKSISAEIEQARRIVDFGEDAADEEDVFDEGEYDDSPEVPYAFAFDIDGVLMRGGTPIPEAIDALAILNGNNARKLKVPYIFITNGGGKLEEHRVAELQEKLKQDCSIAQFIQSHTPFRGMTDKYETVLVVGGEGHACRDVAESYGFKNVVIPGDIIAWDPSVVPFRTLTKEELEHCRPQDFSKIKIDAIFVFADSRDWAGDQQIILDLLLSKGGYMGTRSKTFEEGPPIYFSNPDVLWATPNVLPRYGMGALRMCIEALFREATDGKPFKCTQLGKPYNATYEYATRVLTEWRALEHGIEAPPRNIYMVGDGPNSDIRGGNMAGWETILVETGIYDPADGPPKYKPSTIQKNVLEAVKWAMAREEEIGGF
ncbi:hypothetical protein PYCC9005_005224 [Savitreella phatthalungensis]